METEINTFKDEMVRLKLYLRDILSHGGDIDKTLEEKMRKLYEENRV